MMLSISFAILFQTLCETRECFLEQMRELLIGSGRVRKNILVCVIIAQGTRMLPARLCACASVTQPSALREEGGVPARPATN